MNALAKWIAVIMKLPILFAYLIFSFHLLQKKDDSEALEEEGETKPPLTGIPQIDYIWDPNLPRELNG